VALRLHGIDALACPDKQNLDAFGKYIRKPNELKINSRQPANHVGQTRRNVCFLPEQDAISNSDYPELMCGRYKEEHPASENP